MAHTELFESWLQLDSRKRIVLIVLNTFDTNTVEEKAYYFSNNKYISPHTDPVLPDIAFDDVIISIPSITSAISGEFNIGSVQIYNDGTYDSLLSESVYGQDLLIYMGDEEWPLNSSDAYTINQFELIFKGSVEKITSSKIDRLVINFIDEKLKFKNLPLYKTMPKVAASPAATGRFHYLDGSPAEIQIPIVLGEVFNVKCLLSRTQSLYRRWENLGGSTTYTPSVGEYISDGTDFAEVISYMGSPAIGRQDYYVTLESSVGSPIGAGSPLDAGSYTVHASPAGSSLGTVGLSNPLYAPEFIAGLSSSDINFKEFRWKGNPLTSAEYTVIVDNFDSSGYIKNNWVYLWGFPTGLAADDSGSVAANLTFDAGGVNTLNLYPSYDILNYTDIGSSKAISEVYLGQFVNTTGGVYYADAAGSPTGTAVFSGGSPLIYDDGSPASPIVWRNVKKDGTTAITYSSTLAGICRQVLSMFYSENNYIKKHKPATLGGNQFSYTTGSPYDDIKLFYESEKVYVEGTGWPIPLKEKGIYYIKLGSPLGFALSESRGGPQIAIGGSLGSPAFIYSAKILDNVYTFKQISQSYALVTGGSPLDPAGVPVGNITTEGGLHLAELGLYSESNDTLETVFDALSSSVGASWGFNRFGQLKFYYFDIPANLFEILDSGQQAEIQTIEKDNIIISKFTAGSQEKPNTEVVLDFKINNNVQSKDSLASISWDNAEVFSLGNLTVKGTNTFIAKEILADNIKRVKSLLYNESDANVDLLRRLNIRSTHRQIYKMTVVGLPFSLNVGDPVYVKHSRFQFTEVDPGALGLLIGIVEKPGINQADLEVWF